MDPNLPLREIHLPDPVSWWPPAIGWWLLLFGLPTLVALLVWLWRRWRKMTVRKLALREFESLAQTPMDAGEKVQRLAILLRQICLSAYPRAEVAGLVGADWLAFLDRQLGDRRFSEGEGRLLLEAPYRRQCDADLEALFALCRLWLKRLPKSVQPPAATKP